MIRLLLDMGLPRRAATDLRALSYDVQHVAEAGNERAADEQLLRIAADQGRVIVTLDADFSRLLALGGSNGPSVIHIRLPGLSRTELVRLLVDLVPSIESDLESGCIASITPGGVRVRRLPIRARD